MPFLSFHIVEDGSELEMAAPSCPSSLSLPQSAWANWICPIRIVMAPLTRMRAGPIDHMPTALQAEYYAQQASSGLIVAEATAISPPITSCGKVEDNHPDRAAYLGHVRTAYAALTRGLPVHPGEAAFVSRGGELPRNFVDGPIIWKDS